MAITVTPAGIGTKFSEFAQVDPDIIQRWIDEATSNVNETQWASKASSAVEFLTAHYLTLFADPDCIEFPPGPVTSEREGQVQASYKVADRFADDSLGSTKYGRQFKTMLKRLFVTRKI